MTLGFTWKSTGYFRQWSNKKSRKEFTLRLFAWKRSMQKDPGSFSLLSHLEYRAVFHF